MAETQQKLTKRITKVNKNGFMVEGYENWFNLSKSHEDSITIPPVGTEIEFTYNPWTNPTTKNVTYYVDEIIPTIQIASPVAANQPAPTHAASYADMQAASTDRAAMEAPRTAPESLTPDPGSFAYRDTIGIPRTACL
ncbi:hypothetical protein LCGC14_2816790, partial [marine sediment metagenome]